jgi:hypothetical protein
MAIAGCPPDTAIDFKSTKEHYMRFTLAAILLCFIAPLAAVASGAAPRGEEMPRTLTMKNGSFPAWVDVRDAWNDLSGWNAQLLGPHVEALSELMSAGTNSDCIPVGKVHVDHAAPPPRDSFETAARNAALPLLVRVTDRSFGFFGGTPGQLIQARVLRAFDGKPKRELYYFFLPVGRFRVGDKEICKTDDAYHAAPEVGSEVLLFGSKPWDGEGKLLGIYGPGDIVAFTGDSAQLPAQYRGVVGSIGSRRNVGKSEILRAVERARATVKVRQ